jgi:2-oxoglutarate dehydrogenase E2 component (dihydrolipoamide succinyltransferase)
MVVDIKVPSPGESITEVEISQWMVDDGDVVEEGQVIGEIDSDKATLELISEASGTISIIAQPLVQSASSHKKVTLCQLTLLFVR